MNKLQYHPSKVLKLTNVLKSKILISDEDFNFSIAIEQMQSYIKTKGALQVGPLIQCSRTIINDNGEMDFDISMMLQCNNFIHNVEVPYSMESVIRITDAMYCRYIGPEDKLKLAYDKINIEAFEYGIELSECNYTIFVSQSAENETITADVFVPRK
jgi:hypothetical protein